MSNNIYLGDVGTEILIDMQQDISTATDKSLKIRFADATTTTWSPTIVSSNYLRYIIQDGDLDVQGKCYVQPYLEFATWQGHGDTVNFTIRRLYD